MESTYKYSLEYFVKRISTLRKQKNMSAREMSFAIGQSESYMNKLERLEITPSYEMFMTLCTFFELTPTEFFDEELSYPYQMNLAVTELRKMNSTQLDHVIAILRDINSDRKS